MNWGPGAEKEAVGAHCLVLAPVMDVSKAQTPWGTAFAKREVVTVQADA